MHPRGERRPTRHGNLSGEHNAHYHHPADDFVHGELQAALVHRSLPTPALPDFDRIRFLPQPKQSRQAFWRCCLATHDILPNVFKRLAAGRNHIDDQRLRESFYRYHSDVQQAAGFAHGHSLHLDNSNQLFCSRSYEHSRHSSSENE